MTYRELVEICHNTEHCSSCKHTKECTVFWKKACVGLPCDVYKLLFPEEFDFDAEIEVIE